MPATANGDVVRLLRRMKELEPGDVLRETLRELVIRDQMPHAWRVAVGCGRREVPGADELRTAYRGLASAVDGFDPGSGQSFLAYAIPVILRVVRAQRRADEVFQGPQSRRERAETIQAALDRLGRERERSPSVPELAAAAGESSEETVELLDAALHGDVWIDLPPQPPGPGTGYRRSALVGLDREVLASSFTSLEYRAKRTLLLRFLHGMGRAQIAARLGTSEVQITRLLARSLVELGAVRAGPAGGPSGEPADAPAAQP